MATRSTALANKFLELASTQGKELTQMQLQKLVYIANGWNLAVNETALVSEEPCAWDYGPVYPSLWEALRKYGRETVSDPIKIGDYGLGAFTPNRNTVDRAELHSTEETLVAQVFELYGDFHAFQLSAMTHQDGTPWHQVYVQQGIKKAPIPTETIKSHFVELANTRQVANG